MNKNLLDIKKYPDPILSKVSEDVSIFDENLKKLITSMLDTMYAANGVGLAAVQVGVLKRVFVIDIEYEREKFLDADGNETFELKNFGPQVFINPKLSDFSGESTEQEGCLSLPGLYETVKRAKDVTVKFQDLEGNKKELCASGVLSICLQHETDHLNGKVFLDSLSLIKKKLCKKKYLKGLSET